MGRNYTGSVGFGHHKGWLQVGVPKDTSLQWCESNQCSCKTTKFYKRKNEFLVRKSAIEVVPPSQIQRRFLQYIFSRSKENWRNETSNQFKASQCVSPKTALQNGHSYKGDQHGRKGRLGDINRSKRCISPYYDIQGSSEISEISISRNGLSVPLSLFRSNKCPENVCKGEGSNCRSFKEKRASFGKLQRRLVEFKSVEARSYRKRRFVAQSPLSTRFHDKQRKIPPSSCAGYNLSGKFIRFKERPRLSNTRAYLQSEESCIRIIEGNITARQYIVVLGIIASCPELIPNSRLFMRPLQLHLSQNWNPARLPFSYQIALTSQVAHHLKWWLDTRNISKGRSLVKQIFSLTLTTNASSKWQMGMGRSHEQSNMSGSMVLNGENASYQLFRDESSEELFTAFPIAYSESKCIDSFRQYDCLSIYQSSGGNEIRTIMQSDDGVVGICYSTQSYSENGSYNGKQKYSCRHIKSSESSCNGVVFEHISGREAISDLGKANDRSFCHNREQESASVLLLDSSSGGLCNGCSVNCMAEHVCLCISPSPINSQSTEPLSAVSMHNDTDSPNVAKTTLVSTNSEISNSVSCKSPVPSGSVISVQGESDASKCRVSTSDCMAIIDRKFTSTGFSEKNRQLLSKSWRKGTQKRL